MHVPEIPAIPQTTTDATLNRVDFRPFEAEIKTCSRTWMQSTVFARENPQGVAVYSAHGNRSFLQLHENGNRLANAMLTRGLSPGDAVALLCRNRAEFLEVFLAAMRIGLRLTPINTHLNAAEVAYILGNCEAKAVFVEAALMNELASERNTSHSADIGAEVLRWPALTVVIDGGTTQGIDYHGLLEDGDPAPPSNPVIGSLMLYTSGTTGRPKGVFRETAEPIDPQYAGSHADYDPARDTVLCGGPAYHAAPLLFDLRWPLASGVPIVMLEKWDTLRVLEMIESHAVTHAHMVTTMFQRMLALAPEERAKKDLSSLRFLLHGAAPCPVTVKRAMIDWLGPVLIEYYGATEGGDGIHIKSEGWLKKPGTVGRVDPASGHAILDDQLREVPTGTVGKIYFKAPATGRFSYFGDAEKTADAYAGDRFTMGDMGYIDADGYLFLTGRIAECIISGGVNIYPQEIDDVLLSHPAIRDVCTVGVPDDEWGEQVVSLIVLKEGYVGNVQLADEILKFAAGRLSSFKRPRRILFELELPRSATGKLLRQKVRERFWADRNLSI
jgi:long-chain acyl-CoA synthetase